MFILITHCFKRIENFFDAQRGDLNDYGTTG